MANPLTLSKSNSNGGKTNSDTQRRNELEAQLSSPGNRSSDIHNDERKGAEGRFSIDYSLELERELAMESPPQTPMRATASTSPALDRQASQSSRSAFSEARSVESTPDPEVLAHIVTQLRHSLADMTKEKEELVKLLATANTEEANAKDALQVMTDKATEAEEALAELRKKAREDEEQITMLRAKVEESRRGLMRLQTENRRASMAPIDIARASAAGGGLASFGTTPSAKRASFIPLTGSGKPGGHKRSPSVNDAAAMSTPDHVRAANIASAEAALSGAPSSNSRRVSGFFGRQSPDNLSDGAPEVSASNTIELEAVRKELQAVRDQVDSLKHELVEATEAKEASETCVNALREFIAENNVGVNPLPPPPTMAPSEDSKKSSGSGSGWGFKLWGSAPPVEATNSRSSTTSAPPTAISVAPSMASSTSMSSPVSASAAAPLSRKLTGFFGAKPPPSQEQVLSPAPQPLHLQTNAAKMQLPSQRDSMYSHSDVSSVVEPISPTSDIHGLGSAPYESKIQESDEEDAVDEIPLKEALNLDGGSNPVHVSISASDMQGLR
ncbi:hypothetical protein D9619_013446 [Psilocybe cf. subviscida]|uniref:Uncharacterized protein n=1 Tax=Psilocybe cf. subviscida TaxID=2480587 RepID=A0A8H5F908_9AGAR|nr:hypothetical protein D9619_013446 [Psilocybe cf. subviscida]